MKVALIALLVGLFGMTTVLHANEPTAATTPETETKTEDAHHKKPAQKAKKAKKAKKGAEQPAADAAAPATTETAPTPQ